MNPSAQPTWDATVRLKIHHPNEARCEVGYWRINGYPARIIVWTAEEWARLEEPPQDAQYYPCGVWCALRLD